MGINASGATETEFLDECSPCIGPILLTLSRMVIQSIPQGLFLARKQRNKSINPQDSIETGVE